MRRRIKARYEEQDNKDRWLVSYADFITLLFAFFVVMYSISSVNEGKYRVLSDSISSAFDPFQDGMSVQLETPLKSPIIEHGIMIDSQRPIVISSNYPGVLPGMQSNEFSQSALGGISERLKNSLSSLVDDNLVRIRNYDLWIEVEIKSSILFPSGSSSLSQESLPILEKLSTVLAQYNNEIRVEGFTDNFPIKTEVFPSNWELSASRAASVVHLLSSEGIEPVRLSAVGYGEFRPIASNITALGRSKNRRINIIILSNSLARDIKERR